MSGPDPSKIQSVKSFLTPTNKKQVRRFLGLTGYYRKFIPDYAKIVTPLTDLTRKNKPNCVAWTAECDKSISGAEADSVLLTCVGIT